MTEKAKVFIENQDGASTEIHGAEASRGFEILERVIQSGGGLTEEQVDEWRMKRRAKKDARRR